MGADRGLLQTAARGVAGLGVLAVLLVGCTDDPEPIISTTPTFAETASPTPPARTSSTPRATALTEDEVLERVPDNFLQENFQAAVLFSEMFVELYPGLFKEQPEDELFLALSGPDCDFCAEALERSAATHDAGAYSTGGIFTWPNSAAAQGGPQETGWVVSVPFEVTDTTTLDSSGAQIRDVAGGTGDVLVQLSRIQDRWQVDGVNFDYDDAT